MSTTSVFSKVSCFLGKFCSQLLAPCFFMFGISFGIAVSSASDFSDRFPSLVYALFP